MGNQTSSHNEKNDSKIIDGKLEELSLKPDDSSYSGVVTKHAGSSDTKAIKRLNSEVEKSTDTQENNHHERIEIETKSDNVSFTFEWKEGGRTVYITGSFNNWSQQIEMSRLNDHFEYKMVKVT
jgi:hypothetical protein